MKRLTEEQIKEINKLAPNEWQTNEQGIFTQPYGVPVLIKEPVIYCRYESGGVSGGSCWDESDPQPYERDAPKDKMRVLDLVLKEISPDISFLQFREIEKLVHTNSETEYEYYGNCTEFEIEYIVLSELYDFLENL